MIRRVPEMIRPHVTLRDLRTQTDEGRQTPRRASFGTILARGVQTALLAGANLLGPAAPAGIAVAASIGAAATAAGGSTVPGAAGLAPLAGGAAGPLGAPQSTEAQLLAQQEAMRAHDRAFNLQYLELQRKVQEDQRQFSVATNLLKAQHETVKTAINNLR
jgi:hypothetical protein